MDSCQMLIKAKERKTLVSPAKGVASQEMAGLSAPPSATTTIDGGGYTGESVCQDFYPVGITTGLQPTGCPSLSKWSMLGSRLLLGWLSATDLAIT